MISEQMSQIIEASVASRDRRASERAELSERRRRMQMAADRMPEPAGVTVEPVNADGIPCEWIRPANVAGPRVLLYFHGGGYAVGGLDTHRKMIGFLARSTGLTALSVGYRLAPEHPYPAAVDDSIRALSWLTATGVAASDIVAAGDSAGGGLALAVCLAARDKCLPTPGALVLLSPWVDMTSAGSPAADAAVDDPIVNRPGLEKLRDWYIGDGNPAAPLASPALADLTGLPPTLIQVGQRELLRADAERLHRLLLASGIEASCDAWEGMVHAWHFFAGYAPESDAALASVAQWLHAHARPTSA